MIYIAVTLIKCNFSKSISGPDPSSKEPHGSAANSPKFNRTQILKSIANRIERLREINPQIADFCNEINKPVV